jgi:hypothetical protein
LWPSLYFWSKKSYSEKELIQISPKFDGINGKNYAWTFLWIIIAMSLIFGVKNKLDFPVTVIVFSSLAIIHATFALYYGVYPVPKALSYYYADSLLTRRIAISQIVIAITLSILSVLFH